MTRAGLLWRNLSHHAPAHLAASLGVAVATFLTAAAVSIYARGFARLVPILAGVLAGYALSLASGATSWPGSA